MAEHKQDRVSTRGWGLTIRVIAVVATGVLVAVMIGGGGDADLDPGSPEGAVQQYVQAFIDGDEDEAMALVVDPDCRDGDLIRRTEEGVRVTLLEVSETTVVAEVRLLVTTSGGDLPFDRYEWSEEVEFRLEKSGDDSWMIEDIPRRFSLCETEVPNP